MMIDLLNNNFYSTSGKLVVKMDILLFKGMKLGETRNVSIVCKTNMIRNQVQTTPMTCWVLIEDKAPDPLA